MSLKFAKDRYKLSNPQKYVGNKAPIYRSSWELSVMRMCDNNPAILNWASEPVQIPYRDPLTGKQTVYVPDFLVVYVDANQKKHTELWEVKPAKQAFRESVGKNAYDQANYIRNLAKWEVARQWCKRSGLSFRIITEKDLFHNGNKKG